MPRVGPFLKYIQNTGGLTWLVKKLLQTKQYNYMAYPSALLYRDLYKIFSKIR